MAAKWARCPGADRKAFEDASGYISNLAAPHAATVASQARIAKAHADQEAAERELAAAAMKAQFERDTAIKRAGFLAEAQAEAIRARADSLREGNAELIAANRLVEILPSLVEAAARGLAESNLTVLNGTQGVNEVVAGLVGQGLTTLDTLKKSVPVTGHGVTGHGVTGHGVTGHGVTGPGVTGNGAAPVAVPAVARADL